MNYNLVRDVNSVVTEVFCASKNTAERFSFNTNLFGIDKPGLEAKTLVKKCDVKIYPSTAIIDRGLIEPPHKCVFILAKEDANELLKLSTLKKPPKGKMKV